MTDNVDYRLMNRSRVEEACRLAEDDEAVLCGWLRCTKCGNEFMSLSPIPDWALAPLQLNECESCGEMAAAYMVTDDFVRICSDRQAREED